MSQQQHTQEPWAVSVEIFDNDGVPETAIQALNRSATVAVALDFGLNNPEMREANARRIVACVNACEGIPTDALEREPYLSTASYMIRQDAMKQRDDALAQRDTLLAALEKQQLDTVCECKNCMNARAAIASVKEQA